MCDHLCDDLETLNPEKEFRKFIMRKPVVQTSKFYENLPKPKKLKCPYNFSGYGMESDFNAMYRTHNSEYGYYAPNAYTIAQRHFPLTQSFSNEISAFGMYRNFSLNTHMDRTFY